MPPSKRPAITIRHVAAEAGVSLQTVSRVINNGPNVREAVKARVEEVVARLGYVPNLAAQRLGGSRSYLILALNDRDRTVDDWRRGEGTDWIDQMLFGGMLKCAEHNYRMLFELVDTHSAHVEREIRAALSALHPDGVILTPPHSDNPVIVDLLAALHVPFARIGSVADGAGFAIAMDDGRAAQVAAEHLIALGHRRIGFITGSDEYALSGARLEGYRTALRGAGLGNNPQLVGSGDFSFASGLAAAEALCALSEPPTAIIASNDQMALATLQVARTRGLDVPTDLSLISFDDTPVVRFSGPPLTAIKQPIAAMAARAAELLIEAKSGTPSPLMPVILPFELVVRGSTAACGG